MTIEEKIEALCAWGDANISILPLHIRLSACENITNSKRFIERNVTELRYHLEKKSFSVPCKAAYLRLYKLKILPKNNL